METASFIDVSDLKFDYGEDGFSLDVDELRIDRGEKVAFVGPSGSGKTTLIYLISGILKPASGSITVGGLSLAGKSDTQLRDFRSSKIGFIFQEFELLEYLTTTENVLLPYFVNKSLKLDAGVREMARKLIESVGLCDMFDRKPHQLSHGERQRVAICRALVTRPEIIVADEPTGNLDPTNTSSVLEMLMREVAKRNTTLIVVTHDHSLLGSFDRTVDLGSYVKGACT